MSAKDVGAEMFPELLQGSKVKDSEQLQLCWMLGEEEPSQCVSHVSIQSIWKRDRDKTLIVRDRQVWTGHTEQFNSGGVDPAARQHGGWIHRVLTVFPFCLGPIYNSQPESKTHTSGLNPYYIEYKIAFTLTNMLRFSVYNSQTQCSMHLYLSFSTFPAWIVIKYVLLLSKCSQTHTHPFFPHQVRSLMLRTWTASPVTKAASSVNAVSGPSLSPSLRLSLPLLSILVSVLWVQNRPLLKVLGQWSVLLCPLPCA